LLEKRNELCPTQPLHPFLAPPPSLSHVAHKVGNHPIDLPPNSAWAEPKNIVSFDSVGPSRRRGFHHHLAMSEAARKASVKINDSIVLRQPRWSDEQNLESSEFVWYLPSVVERFGM
jgi:hypothetical protein